MGRLGFICALSALLLIIAAAQSDSNSTSSSSSSITPPFPNDDDSDNGANKTKNDLGQGRGRENYGNRNDRRGNRHYSRHHDEKSEEYGYDIHPQSRVKPYFDTHYCSVHGSFRLAYNEKVEKKDYKGGENYQQTAGYSAQGGQNSYGNGQAGYGDRPSYEDKPRYVRKITRQYCRYAAAWSEKACKFCCKVVARSAYTNPDDIIAAIFSFDPANPSSGGAGVENYSQQNEKSGEHEQSYGGDNDNGANQAAYGSPPEQYDQYGGGNQGGYGSPPQQYGGGNQGYVDGNQGYGSSPAKYGSGPYRTKRNSGYSQAPAYGVPAPAQSNDQYSPADQGQYSATAEAYEQKPDYGNKYENNPKAINQCVCCAPKHRYY